METKGVAQAMARVLRSSACRRIDFYVGSFHVDAAGFELVAKGLDAGKIKVVVFEDLEGGGGAYSDVKNTIVVDSVDICTHWGGRNLVVHEAVHALFDIRNAYPPLMTGEATSYIAGALYDGYALREFITTGISASVTASVGTRGRFSGSASRAIGVSKVYAAKKGMGGLSAGIGISKVGGTTEDDHIDKEAAAIHKAAYEAAATIVDRTAARVSDDLVKKITKALLAHPIYAKLAKAHKHH